MLATTFSLMAVKQFTIEKEIKKAKRANTLEVIYQNIEQSLKNAYISTLTLALTIGDDGVPEDFEGIAQKLLNSNANLSAVQLVPNGIIKYTFPVKGNEAAMNLNILETVDLKEDALKSMKFNKMVFSGPLVLRQGGRAIVGRLPVYIKGKFWGFSAVIIKLDKFFIAAGVNIIDTTKYEFQLSKKNYRTGKTDLFVLQKTKFTDDNFVKRSIPEGQWNIYLIDKQMNRLLINLVVSLFLGLLLALVFAMLTILLLNRATQLKILVEEQALNIRDNEIKFKTIFDQAAVGIANVDIKTGRFIEVNSYFCKMLGYTQEEMKSNTFQAITHIDDLTEDVKNVKKLKEGEIDAYTLEKRYLSKDGNIVWGNLNVTPLLNQDKKQISVIAIIENITARKANENTIKRNENHFKALFDDSPLPIKEEDYSNVKIELQLLGLINKSEDDITIFLSNHSLILDKIRNLIKINHVNKACLTLNQVESKEQLIEFRKNNLNTIESDHFIKLLVAIATNKQRFEIDTSIIDKSNTLRYITYKWNVIGGYENSLEKTIVTTEDVTERKNAEKEISNSQQKVQSLINTIDGIVWETDANVNFTFISKKVEAILGYTSEEWLSSKTFWVDHIYKEDKDFVLSFCTAQTAANMDHDFEYRMIAKNGSIIWLRDIVNLNFDANGKLQNLRGIMIDITKTKEIESYLKSSFNLVSEQNKRLLNFSYIVSHNLRSHTSNITSLTDLIQHAETTEEKDELIELLKQVSNALNDTLYNLNEVVNIQTNLNLLVESIKLKPYLDNTLTVLSNEIRTNKIAIISNVSEDIEIQYNPAYLESILYNMISNAVRYCDKNRQSEVNITYSCEDGKKYITIRDNGIGIDLNRNGNKIFGMYKTFTDNVDSKGIGLFITKNQIEAMGGTVTVESTLGEGTTFKIQLA